MNKKFLVLVRRKGGAGSGNFGHTGRPGLRGGSGGSGGGMAGKVTVASFDSDWAAEDLLLVSGSVSPDASDSDAIDAIKKKALSSLDGLAASDIASTDLVNRDGDNVALEIIISDDAMNEMEELGLGFFEE